MIDFDDLSPEEIEEVYNRAKSLRESFRGNKTFELVVQIKANPNISRKEDWMNDIYNDLDCFQDYIGNMIYEEMIEKYDLRSNIETVSVVSCKIVSNKKP